jgi:hypothetical protein
VKVVFQLVRVVATKPQGLATDREVVVARPSEFGAE